MKEQKRGAKTESLSLRIDPKTKFILEFMVRVTGFRITDLIERAIKDYAEKTTIGDGFNDQRNWMHYWHPEDGVRTVKILLDNDLRTTFEEDELREFIKTHRDFFFSDNEMKRPTSAFIEVLWPKISEFLEHWRDNKAANRWETGTLMMQAIKSAGMQGFDWPRKSKPAPAPPAPSRTPPGPDLDDEIPF